VLSTFIKRVTLQAYVYRPLQVLQRMRLRGHPHPMVRLPWGHMLQVTATESIGSGIARAGIHELVVTEAMFRLLEPGDLAVDAGANIGYFTSLMAFCVGAFGEVVAFEPHPILVDALRTNVARWNQGQVTVDPRAASGQSGTARLQIPDAFAMNMGTASLVADSGQGVAVQTTSLDQVLRMRPIALLKIDVEGHELCVLDGATALLRAGLIRHVIFEEHEPLPTPVSERLQESGFTVFAIRESFRGIAVADSMDLSARPRWGAPTYLATVVPDEVRQRLRTDGWRSLRP
jgi:FkbM family methyltransferase